MDFNNMQLLKDNSFNELNNMPVTLSGLLQQYSSRTTPLMSSKTTIMPKTILWAYIQFAKDNLMDF